MMNSFLRRNGHMTTRISIKATDAGESVMSDARLSEPAQLRYTRPAPMEDQIGGICDGANSLNISVDLVPGSYFAVGEVVGASWDFPPTYELSFMARCL